MLAGHNRQNAGELAGLKEMPAIVKESLPDDETYVYVIETYLMQRSFTDLPISEKLEFPQFYLQLPDFMALFMDNFQKLPKI